jgi:hypothetical protein
MALDQQLWLSTIQKQLYLSDEFLNTVGLDHSGYVNNLTVHIPQAGSNPTVSKNLSSFPAAIGSRTDSDLTYNMNLYYSQPIRVGIDETQFISYDKRASVLDSHLNKMRNVIGNNTLYAWAPSGAATQLRTTGATAVATALAPSATGTRKPVTLQDFMNAASLLDMQNLNPADQRYCIIPSNMYYQMVMDTNISKYLEYGASPVAPTGVVPMLAGFKIIKRSSVVVFDNTGTPVIKTVGDDGVPSSPATTDNMAALFVSSSYVSRAFGAINVYTLDKDPSYYGDILSTTVCQGASKMRTGQEGIVALIQTT